MAWRWLVIWAVLAHGCLTLAPGTGLAKPQIVVRVTTGDHPGFSRVVLNAPGLAYTITREDGRVVVRFADDPAIGTLPPAPRNVLGLRAVPGGAELTVAEGAKVRDTRMGDRVVIDIDDVPAPRSPPPGEPAADKAEKKPEAAVPPGKRRKPEPPAAAAVPMAAPPAGKLEPVTATPVQTPATPQPAAAPPEPAPPAVAIAVPATPGDAGEKPAAPPVEPDAPRAAKPGQIWPVTRDALPSGPVALAAAKARPPTGLTGAAIQVPFAEAVGAALFSRGSDTYVIFDERRPIDLAALRGDAVFGSAVVTIHPAATVIRLTMPQGQAAMLTHEKTGWRISVVSVAPKPAALTPVSADGVMTFAAEAPGQVVAIANPQTGGTLLVGTQRKPGQGVLVERHTAEFNLPVTGQGIVVDPLSDAIALRITQAGFVLGVPASGPAGYRPATLVTLQTGHVGNTPIQYWRTESWPGRWRV